MKKQSIKPSEITLEKLYELILTLPTKDDLKNFITKEDAKAFVTKDDLKNFATKDDSKNFATKDDLKNFATKDDLKNFATKDDLKNFATKDDLKNFATKDDIDKIWKELKKRPTTDEVKIIVREEIKEELKDYPTRKEIQYDLKDRPTKYEIEEMLKNFRDDFYNKIDPILTEVVNAREDREITTYEIRQIKKRLDDHDKLFRQLLHN